MRLDRKVEGREGRGKHVLQLGGKGGDVVASLQAVCFLVVFVGVGVRGSALLCFFRLFASPSPSFSPFPFTTEAGIFCQVAQNATPHFSRAFLLLHCLSLLPCAAQPPFLLPQCPQPSIPSKGRQQDTPTRGLAGKGQGQLM